MKKKARVLIVEDEIISARAAELMLTASGCEVTCIVKTGEEAILAAGRESPDLVLMDIRLKGKMNGIEAGSLIYKRFGTPVAFVSAYSPGELLELRGIPDAFYYLEKPINETELCSVVETIVRRKTDGA